MAKADNLVALVRGEHISPTDTGDNISAKRVVPYEYDTANANFYRKGLARTERYDYSSSTTIYTGAAPLGTSESSTGWTITKYDLSSSSDATAEVAIDVSWANRATGTYQ